MYVCTGTVQNYKSPIPGTMVDLKKTHATCMYVHNVVEQEGVELHVHI